MGKYVDSILVRGEIPKYETKAHWFVYLPGLITLPIGIGLFFLFAAWLGRKTSEFVVTNRRIIVKTGIFSRRTCEIRLDKVEGVLVSQGILDRMFDCGNITVTGTGGLSQKLNTIASPIRFKRIIDEQIGLTS